MSATPPPEPTHPPRPRVRDWSFLTKVYLLVAGILIVFALSFATRDSKRYQIAHGLSSLGFGVAAGMALIASAMVHRPAPPPPPRTQGDEA